MAELSKNARTSNLGASVAGASSGTGLLAIVNALPADNPWKPLILFATPTISIVVSALWLFTMRQIDEWIADRSLTIELNRAEAALKSIDADPLSSDKLKKEARTKVEALRLLKVTLHSNRAQEIVTGATSLRKS